MKRITIMFAALLAGCVTVEETESYRRAVEAWERVEIARAHANAKRFDALAEVARTGGETSKVAVAFAVSGGSSSSITAAAPLPAAPDSETRFYRWASLILPTATTLGSGYFGYKLGVAQSNNAARMTEASYGALSTGFGAIRDVATSAFETMPLLPGTTYHIQGNGNATAFGAGNATLDNSRRCSTANSLAGSANGGAGGGGAGTGGAGGAGGTAPTFTLPFTC